MSLISLVDVSTVNSLITVAGSATQPVYDILANYQAPSVDWNPGEDLKDACRKGAFFLAAVWLFWVLFQFALPKKRQMMAGGGMGAGRFVGAAALIVILLDIELVPTIINWVLEGIWWVGSLLGIV